MVMWNKQPRHTFEVFFGTVLQVIQTYGSIIRSNLSVVNSLKQGYNLAVAGDVFDGVLFCAILFPHEMSLMRSGIELNQFIRIVLHTIHT